jgi:hypothetical protein
MTVAVDAVLPAFLGAVLQELLYWWQLRYSLDDAKLQALLRSRQYWIIVGLMVAGSTLGTVYWFWSEKVGPKDYLLVGAAFPMLFKSAVSTTVDSRKRLGQPNSTFLSYFTMR